MCRSNLAGSANVMRLRGGGPFGGQKAKGEEPPPAENALSKTVKNIASVVSIKLLFKVCLAGKVPLLNA